MPTDAPRVTLTHTPHPIGVRIESGVIAPGSADLFAGYLGVWFAENQQSAPPGSIDSRYTLLFPLESRVAPTLTVEIIWNSAGIGGGLCANCEIDAKYRLQNIDPPPGNVMAFRPVGLSCTDQQFGPGSCEILTHIVCPSPTVPPNIGDLVISQLTDTQISANYGTFTRNKPWS